MTTLSQLLSDPQTRDAAPCVPVTGDWVLTSCGGLVPAALWSALPVKFGHCIWSGDLVAELVAVDALRDEVETWRSVFPDVAPESVVPDRSAMEAEIARLRAKNEQLHEALTPFGNVSTDAVRTGVWHHHDEHAVMILSPESFARARQAMKGFDA